MHSRQLLGKLCIFSLEVHAMPQALLLVTGAEGICSPWLHVVAEVDRLLKQAFDDWLPLVMAQLDDIPSCLFYCCESYYV